MSKDNGREQLGWTDVRPEHPRYEIKDVFVLHSFYFVCLYLDTKFHWCATVFLGYTASKDLTNFAIWLWCTCYLQRNAFCRLYGLIFNGDCLKFMCKKQQQKQNKNDLLRGSKKANSVCWLVALIRQTRNCVCASLQTITLSHIRCFYYIYWTGRTKKLMVYRLELWNTTQKLHCNNTFTRKI